MASVQPSPSLSVSNELITPFPSLSQKDCVTSISSIAKSFPPPGVSLFTKTIEIGSEEEGAKDPVKFNQASESPSAYGAISPV